MLDNLSLQPSSDSRSVAIVNSCSAIRPALSVSFCTWNPRVLRRTAFLKPLSQMRRVDWKAYVFIFFVCLLNIAVPDERAQPCPAVQPDGPNIGAARTSTTVSASHGGDQLTSRVRPNLCCKCIQVNRYLVQRSLLLVLCSTALGLVRWPEYSQISRSRCPTKKQGLNAV
jgi:hypothetical protein